MPLNSTACTAFGYEVEFSESSPSFSVAIGAFCWTCLLCAACEKCRPPFSLPDYPPAPDRDSPST
jgi:hypothetical protein